MIQSISQLSAFEQDNIMSGVAASNAAGGLRIAAVAAHHRTGSSARSLFASSPSASRDRRLSASRVEALASDA